MPQIIAQKKKKLSRRKLRKELNAWQVYENLRTFTEGHMHFFFIGFEFPYNEKFLFVISGDKNGENHILCFKGLRYLSIVEWIIIFFFFVLKYNDSCLKLLNYIRNEVD